MAKKKATKEIKRLKRRAKEAQAASLMFERRVRKLKRKLDARKQQVADLEARLGRAQVAADVNFPSGVEFGGRDATSIASSHRATWKQHRYLRDRYEFHLDAGASKERARHLANEDLREAYGPGCGYTEEELTAILS